MFILRKSARYETVLAFLGLFILLVFSLKIGSYDKQGKIKGSAPPSLEKHSIKWIDSKTLNLLIDNAIREHPAWKVSHQASQPLEIQPKSLNRIKLRPCMSEIQSSVQGTALQPRVQVSLRCDQPLWNISIPVKIHSMAKIAVLNQAIGIGQAIRTDQIDWVLTNVLELKQGYFTDTEALQHRVAKRRLAPGTLLTTHLLKAANVIKKGDDVIISVSTPYLQVRMPGEALTDGQLGQQLAVRNRQSEIVIRAKAIAPGRVAVPF